MNPLVKKFAEDHLPDAKNDLFACFIERGYTLAKNAGHNAMVTMQSWMFLSSFGSMRERMLREKTICTMAHLGARAFGSISGEVVQTTASVLQNQSIEHFRPVFFRLLDGGEDEKQTALGHGKNRFDHSSQEDFQKIPGSPVAYWVTSALRDGFVKGTPLRQLLHPAVGLQTGANEVYVRRWGEVDWVRAATGMDSRSEAKQSRKKWFPYNKGGALRRWYGNQELLVNWEDDGQEIRAVQPRSVIRNPDRYFCEGITWSDITTQAFAARYSPRGFVFDVKGSSGFPELHDVWMILGLMNSCLMDGFMAILNPTTTFQVGDLSRVPALELLPNERASAVARTKLVVAAAQVDWDAYERSWDFQSIPLLTASDDPAATLEASYTAWVAKNRETIAEMQRLEEENNRLFIEAYGLQDELTPEVPLSQITLTVNPAYRYGGKLTEEEQWSRFRADTMKELISYAIGCMMGRYSLDEPGLIYAHSGNEGFDPSRYATFPVDDDGIVPLTDTDWFPDDACHRLIEFLSLAWDKAHLEENLTFLAANLAPKKNESSRETIRRYLCDRFFKDHLQGYKKRPIYWLFSSGKQKAFQCLVYLHRYNESTLARMRTEYVIPLQGKLAARIEQLDGDIATATSTAHRNRLVKERERRVKQRDELRLFDEKLRHVADERIALDLDDGVKVNYGKFGDLLAEVKVVTGKRAG